MKTLSLFFSLILVLLAQSCMKAAEDPSLTIDGNKIGFGGYGGGNGTGQLSLSKDINNVINNYTSSQYVKIYVGNGSGPFSCSNITTTGGSLATVDEIYITNAVYPYNQTFNYCEVEFMSYMNFNTQIIEVTDSTGKVDRISIEAENIYIHGQAGNHHCAGSKNADGSPNYSCYGLGYLYGIGSSGFQLDLGAYYDSYEDKYYPYTVDKFFTGANHTCIRAYNSYAGSKFLCLGDNTYGQLGMSNAVNGTYSNDVLSNLTSITEIPAISSTYVNDIAVGKYHTCARVDDSGEKLKCWGKNDSGQIGLNPGTTSSTYVANTVFSGYSNYLGLGDSHTCFTSYSGYDRLYCFGDNTYGQLGLNSTTSTYTYSEVTSITSSVRHLALGAKHTCYSKYVNSPPYNYDIYCFGDNTNNQLGGFDPTAIGNFNNILGDSTGEMSSITKVDLGTFTIEIGEYDPVAYTTAGAQVTYDYQADPYQGFASKGNKTCVKLAIVNKMKCWGDGAEVAEVDNISSFSLSETKTCVVYTDNSSQCWE